MMKYTSVPTALAQHSNEDQEKFDQRLIDEMKRLARDKSTTPFDYIIIGSGAGGGPLAARLAQAGRTVLLLEAGIDPSLAPPENLVPSTATGNPDFDLLNETINIPGYHAAATENKEISWDFSVRHYEDDVAQAKDTKYDAKRDPSKKKGKGKGGIFYPRTAALGGCTAHHAMIMIAPADRDWDLIAERTGDPTWAAGNMQRYFTRLEKCLYQGVYDDSVRKAIGLLYDISRHLISRINPRALLDRGGHGTDGWQPTSFVNPSDVLSIVKNDGNLRSVLFGTFKGFLSFDFLNLLKLSLFQLGFINFLDPNNSQRRARRAEGVVLVPIGTDGVRRRGVREFLVETQQRFSKMLVIQTGVHATRLQFTREEGTDTPRAIGVEVAEGVHLYEATPEERRQIPPEERHSYFARKEVIICGGSFNTPQLLMLSGIGHRERLGDLGITHLLDEEKVEVCPALHLPGVGENLQDRYEVTVVSQANQDFSTLKTLSFTPGDVNDDGRTDWYKEKKGLLTTNGGAIAFFEKSKPDLPEPDLFIFGAPVAFRGYYWDWSKELLRATKGAAQIQRNLWSWVILKAYTKNNQGTVRLLSDSPFARPDICFANFPKHTDGWMHDRDALNYAIARARELNSKLGFQVEIQPGVALATGSDQLLDWVQNETWGHHACGTCRMGSDRWVPDTALLKDKFAVLDPEFRVHGVSGLRVVDASVFPDIPGYFIVTPVFMVSEKAADTILAESQDYPEPLEAAEALAVNRRRQIARDTPLPQERALPRDTVGLALSGGGIRSSTFCLGVLQGLAAKDRIRDLDFLSTVSGGGYIGAFLGRLFTRIGEPVADKVGRVQEILTNHSSPELSWLRSTANYISSGGSANFSQNLAMFFRNIFTVHLVNGALFFVVFGALRWVADHWLGEGPRVAQVPLSPWIWVPVVVAALGILPPALGYWLAPNKGSSANYSLYPLLAWLVLVFAAVAALQLPGVFIIALGLIGVLFAAFIAQEIARWGLPSPSAQGATASIVRHRLSGALTAALSLLAGSVYFVLLDSVARLSIPTQWTYAGFAMMAGLPVLRKFASFLNQTSSKPDASPLKKSSSNLTAGIAAVILLTVLFFVVDFAVHQLFNANAEAAGWTVVTLLIFSIVIGRAIGFVNLSSLHPTYASRLIRSFLGAANSRRVNNPLSNLPLDVELADPYDDVAMCDYHPETHGGPLHLINVCLNQTQLPSSEVVQPDLRGLPMSVGPAGISVGVRFHSLWTTAEPPKSMKSQIDDLAGNQAVDTPPSPLERLWRRIGHFFRDKQVLPSMAPVALHPIPSGSHPDGFHVLGRRDGRPAEVESLSLGQWTATSGAFFTTGSGRLTTSAMSLLHGLLNIRLGYWWDSGIAAGDRPGRYPSTLLQRLKNLPSALVCAQSILIDELRARFRGPSRRFWYLSDGGHFEVSGTYELIRRRLALIIAVDSDEDPNYLFNNGARIDRIIERDFGAKLTMIDPRTARTAGLAGWDAIQEAVGPRAIPPLLVDWLNPDLLCAREEIGRDGPRSACLACLTYSDDVKAASWLVILKPALTGSLPLGIQNYAASHPDFPNQTTTDQFFDDPQWEAYRGLGEQLGSKVFRNQGRPT